MMSRAGTLAKAVASFCLYIGLASCSYEANSPILNTDGGSLAPGVPQIMDVSSSPITGGSSMLTITGKNLQKASFVINNSTQPISAPVNAQDTQVTLSVNESILNSDSIIGVAGVASIYAFSASGAGPIKKFNFFQKINTISYSSMDSNNELGVSGFIDQDNALDRVAVGGTGNAGRIFVNVSGKSTQNILPTPATTQVLWVILTDIDGDRSADLVFSYIESALPAKVKIGIFRNNTAAQPSSANYFDTSADLAGNFDTQLTVPAAGGYAFVVVSDVNKNGLPDITLILTTNTSATTKTFFR